MDSAEITQLRNKLHRIELRFHKAQELLNFGMWNWNMRTNQLSWSDQVFRNFGYAPGSVDPSFDFFIAAVHPQDRDALKNKIMNCISDGEDYRAEFRIIRPDGTQRTIQACGTIIYESNEIAELIGIDLDITEARECEKRRKRFEFMVEISGHEAYLVSPEGAFHYVNDAAAKSLGYTVDELMKLSVPEIDPFVGPVFHKHFLELKHGQVPSFETVHISRNGRRIPKEIKSFYLKLDGEEFICGFGMEISERKRNEAQIKKALEEKQVLLRELHHRVKNNLQVVSSLLKLEASNLSTRSGKHVLKETQTRVDAIALVHDILYDNENLSRLDIADYIDRLVRNLVSVHCISSSRIKIVSNIQPYRLDPDTAIPLGLIITELVSNSLRHAFPNSTCDGTLTVNFKAAANDRLKLEVQDDGIGLPADDDLDQSRRFGLKLVNILAKQLNAELQIERLDPGTGVTLLFKLPEQKIE
jgi:PAS domain S-box-containing protein